MSRCVRSLASPRKAPPSLSLRRLYDSLPEVRERSLPLSEALCAELDAGVPPSPDISHQPPTLDGLSERRAAEAAAGVLLAKGIARDDAAGRRGHHRDNMRFHGAPVEMIFHLQRGSPHG